jgi:hypothetical protein
MAKFISVKIRIFQMITVPQFVVRSLRVGFWFGSPSAMAVLAVSSGILFTLAHGLFFLSRTEQNQRPYRALFLAFAMQCESLTGRGDCAIF